MQTLGRVVGAVILGGLMLFPGVELLRFVVTNLLGLYREMSLTDCLLVFVIILLCVLLLQQRGQTAGERAGDGEPRLALLGNRAERAPRSSRERRTRRSGEDRPTRRERR